MSKVPLYINKSKALANGQGACVLSGAVIVKNEQEIYATAATTLKDDDPTAHAAVIGIRKTRLKQRTFQLIDYEIYLSEKPCPMCLLAIFQAGIKKVYYQGKEKIEEINLTNDYLKKAYTVIKP
ncbi:MAG TPA: deaminase [Bacteroidales bacterium]|jgi:guanine deaminase|nr:nucleoside deaminase [Bacteroidales bacterium]HOF17129.1 deaminase [Bacteroidales bacterium]HON19900.1 deaminase [Bacteroidales bacterium]HOR82895.1 deaminase [Bacteroidales bacterium]HPJ92161.1 deaminase [Bacteroidales bacterium]